MKLDTGLKRRGRAVALVLLALLLAGASAAVAAPKATKPAAAKPAATKPAATKQAPAAKAQPEAPAAAAVPAPRAGNPHGDMSLDCRLCHNAQDIANTSTINFDHTATGFVLEGQHARVACRDCHRQPQFANIGTRCSDCHQDAHQARLGPNCEQCHTPDAWVERTRAQRDHDMTRLPLVGAHAKVDCDACHSGAVSGTYVGTPFECYACHQADFEAASNPDHRTAGFTTDCNRCHGVFSSTWGRGDFVHSLNFPLTGAHGTLACAACHTTGFAGTATDCYACHQPEYDASVNPPHASAGLGTDCATCHASTAWRPTRYDHATTGFALTGGHSQVACASCHQSGYVNTAADCYSCHRPDYEQVADPNHVAGGFPTDCMTCHTTTRWDQSTFDHGRTAFPLTGAHAAQTCTQCHTSGYTGTPTDCYACHRTNYDATTNPGHAAANIPTTCVTCHSSTAWSPAQFNHSTTSFPLTGAHTAQACAACHATGYTGTSTDCYACHQANYTGATNPEHAAAGYPTACVTCHSTTAWSPAQFNHNTTAFPLTGAHRTTACAACHTTGYTGTSTDCYACHQADYTRTTNPSHSAASFPTTCVTCHSTTAWTPSTWDHEVLFPIKTGKHTNLSCTQCHVTPGNYSAFECILCHEHNQADMANDHSGRQNYQWVSSACYNCHPRGRS